MRRIFGVTILAVFAACSSHTAEVKSDEAAAAQPAEAAAATSPAEPAAQPAPEQAQGTSSPKIVSVAPTTASATTSAAPAETLQATSLPPTANNATPASVEAAPVAQAVEVPAPAPRPPVKLSRAINAIVHAKDRTPEDLALDAGRKPGEMLTFFDLKPGMKVAEIGAGGGYTTELLARAVGPTGTVYAQNPPAFLEGFLKKVWPERLARPVNAKVIRVDRDFASPLPDDAKDLDAVVMVAIYHDTVGMEVDRKAMNEAIFKAVKPGGAFYVIDSSAPMETGVASAKTLHRIDEAVVLEETEEAGFRFESESDFLRNPLDTRDWNASPAAAGDRRGTSDRFALKFIKPRHHHRAEKGEGEKAEGDKPAKADKADKSAKAAAAPANAKAPADAKASATNAKAAASDKPKGMPAMPKNATKPAPKPAPKDDDGD